jgi:hypothetical protein
MSFKTLKIGSLEIPVRAAIDADQTYTQLGGETILRTISGAGIRQETWKRTRTTINGNGWLPAALAAIDTTVSMDVACIAPQALVADVNRQATIPAARRSDAGHLPWAFALMPDGALANTTLTIVGNVATAAAVSGSTGYLIHYFPLLHCWVNRPSQSFSLARAMHTWELIAEEV